MSLLGHGFLCLWHNIKTGHEPDFERWHTQEHMAERVGIPGFNRGRRYANYGSKDRAFFSLYEGMHPETFRSPGYLARLNAPTPWAKEVQPLHTDFIRGVCENIFSYGRGVGAAVVTSRILLDAGRETEFIDAARAAAGRALSWDGVNAIHVGICRPELTQTVTTKETQLRQAQSAGTDPKGASAEDVFGAVFILEGIGPEHLRPHLGRLGDMAEAAAGHAPRSEVYGLSYLMTQNG